MKIRFLKSDQSDHMEKSINVRSLVHRWIRNCKIFVFAVILAKIQINLQCTCFFDSV